jgi:hypothetical protein
MKLTRSPWLSQVLHGRVYTLGQRKLFVAVQGGGESAHWIVLAVEIEHGGMQHLQGLDRARAVLDNHAHAVVGERKTERGARVLAERYAEKWAAQQLELERCKCEEIKAVAS